MKNMTAVILFLLGILAFSAEGSNSSVYTSLEVSDCKLPTGVFEKYYPSNEYSESVECKGYKNYRIFITYEDGGWINLSNDKQIWSTSDLIYNYTRGGVPHISGKKAEWRVSKSGELKALIYRMGSTDAIDYKKVYTDLFIISFDTGKPMFCGTAQTNEEARKIADRGNCKIELYEEKI